MILANSSPEEMSPPSIKAPATAGKAGGDDAEASDAASTDQVSTRPQTRAGRGGRNVTHSNTPQRQNGQVYRTKTTANPNGGYHCSYCSRYFSSRSNMVVHERTHTQERPYTCGHCGRSFTQHGQMVIHIRSHTGQRPFQCPHCSKGFTSSKVLKIHIRTHTGEKPYSCEHCGKSFAAYANLVVHRRIHTAASDFEDGKNSGRRVTRKTAQTREENVASNTDEKSPPQALSPMQKLSSNEGSIPHVFVVPRCSFCFALYGTVKDLLEHRCTRLSRRPCHTDGNGRPPSFSELYEYIQNLRKLAQEKEEPEKGIEHDEVAVGTNSKEQGIQTVAPETTEGTTKEMKKNPDSGETLSCDQTVSETGPDSVLKGSSEPSTEIERPDRDLQPREKDEGGRAETTSAPTHLVELEAPQKLAENSTEHQRFGGFTSLRSKSHEDSDEQQQPNKCTDKIRAPRPGTTKREMNKLPQYQDVKAKRIRSHQNEQSDHQKPEQGGNFSSSQSQNEPMSKRNKGLLQLQTKNPFTLEAKEIVVTGQVSPPIQPTQWVSPDKPARGPVHGLSDQGRPRRKTQPPQQHLLQPPQLSPQQSLLQPLPHSPSPPQSSLSPPQQRQRGSPQQPLLLLPHHHPQSLPQQLPLPHQQSPPPRSSLSPQQRLSKSPQQLLPLPPQTALEKAPEQSGPSVSHLIRQRLSQHIPRAHSAPQLPQSPQSEALDMHSHQGNPTEQHLTGHRLPQQISRPHSVPQLPHKLLAKSMNAHSHQANPAELQRPVLTPTAGDYLHRMGWCHGTSLNTPNSTSQVSRTVPDQADILRRGLKGCFADDEEREFKLQSFPILKPQLDKQEAQRQGGVTITPLVLRNLAGSEILTHRHHGSSENMDITSGHTATDDRRTSPLHTPYCPAKVSTTAPIPTSHPNGFLAPTTGSLRLSHSQSAASTFPHHLPADTAAELASRSTPGSAGVGSSDPPVSSGGAPRRRRGSGHCFTATSGSLMSVRPLKMRFRKAHRPMPGLVPVNVLPQTRRLR